MRVYYFGAVDEPGHHWWSVGDRRVVLAHGSIPYCLDARHFSTIDGGFVPPGTEQGVAQVVYLREQAERFWTLVAFWDRTGDSRSGSNSVFAVEGVHSFSAAVDYARGWFPEIFKRFTFPLVEWQSSRQVHLLQGPVDGRSGHRWRALPRCLAPHFRREREGQMTNIEKAQRSGLLHGFKAGWAAACHVIAERMREEGQPEAADVVESWHDKAPDIELVNMLPGETIEEAATRTDSAPEER